MTSAEFSEFTQEEAILGIQTLSQIGPAGNGFAPDQVAGYQPTRDTPDIVVGDARRSAQ